MDVPMLDENEFTEIEQLYMQGGRQAKRLMLETGASSDYVQKCFEPVQREYERLSGLADCNPHIIIMHHRLSLLGPPCRVCGKPLRSPEAKRCVECGAMRDSI